jgi:Flp pilus assembly protein TadG
MLYRPPTKPAARPGTTAVEFAVVIATTLMFLFGIIEYARFLYFLHVANNAVREAARFAVVHTGDGTTLGAQTDKTAPTNSDGSPASGATVYGVVNFYMNGANSALVSGTYTISAYNATPSTGAAIGGTSWNSAAYGGAIAVQVSGTYQFMAASLLKLSSATLTVNVKSMMATEAN